MCWVVSQWFLSGFSEVIHFITEVGRRLTDASLHPSSGFSVVSQWFLRGDSIFNRGWASINRREPSSLQWFLSGFSVVSPR